MSIRKRLNLWLLLAIAFVSAVSFDANANSDNGATKGATTINGFAKAVLARKTIPGFAVAVVVNPKNPKIWTKGFGVMNIENQAPVTGNTSFWIASVSKAIMGTAIMAAQERGFLSLDDDVKTLLSANGKFTVDNPHSHAITFRHLASHTSGIVDGEAFDCTFYVNDGDGGHTPLINLLDDDSPCPKDSPADLAGFLEAYLNANGKFYSRENNFSGAAPGKKFEYSNIGAALAGYSFEWATGQNLADFAMLEIFMPLKMKNTSWRYSDLDPNNVATPHLVFDGKLIALPNYEIATWPDGGVRSSASDLARFLATIMNEGKSAETGARILKNKSIKQMLTPIADASPIVNGVGVFWLVDRNIGHGGSDPGATSGMYFFPEQNIGVVIVANGEDDQIDWDDLLLLLLKKGEAMKPLRARSTGHSKERKIL